MLISLEGLRGITEDMKLYLRTTVHGWGEETWASYGSLAGTFGKSEIEEFLTMGFKRRNKSLPKSRRIYVEKNFCSGFVKAFSLFAR